MHFYLLQIFHCVILLAWKSFSSLPYRTAGCVYGSLSSVLQIFTKQFKDSVKSLPTFNIEEFCNQKSISGQTKKVKAKDVKDTIEEYLKSFKEEDSYKEIAFFSKKL